MMRIITGLPNKVVFAPFPYQVVQIDVFPDTLQTSKSSHLRHIQPIITLPTVLLVFSTARKFI